MFKLKSVFAILFKLKRKLLGFLHLMLLIIKKFEIKKLYPKRFFCDSMFSFGSFFSIDFDLSSSVVIIKDNVRFRDFCKILSGKDSVLEIGKNVFFNNGCSINCLIKIIIGNDCQFGEDVKFYDHNHRYRNSEININEQGYILGAIKIGNNCWIGSNVVILKGVEIGDNVVIGAGCIIHKSIPSNTTLISKQAFEFK